MSGVPQDGSRGRPIELFSRLYVVFPATSSIFLTILTPSHLECRSLLPLLRCQGLLFNDRIKQVFRITPQKRRQDRRTPQGLSPTVNERRHSLAFARAD